MPPFPERESSLLAKLKKKKGGAPIEGASETAIPNGDAVAAAPAAVSASAAAAVSQHPTMAKPVTIAQLAGQVKSIIIINYIYLIFLKLKSDSLVDIAEPPAPAPAPAPVASTGGDSFFDAFGGSSAAAAPAAAPATTAAPPSSGPVMTPAATEALNKYSHSEENTQ